MSNKKKIAFYITCLIILSTLYTIFFYSEIHNLVTTGDVSFHLSRIKGLHSFFLGPVNFETFNNLGYGVNWFYPYLTILPATAIYHFTNDILLSYWLFLLILNILTALISFCCGKIFFRKIESAFLFSNLYTFSLYRTTDIFFRAALAESIALTFIPIIFLGLYKIMRSDNKGVYLLALGMSLTILSHILSTFIIVIILFIVLATFFIKKSNGEREWIAHKIIHAVILTVIATASFVIPMFYMFITNDINKPATTILQSKALAAGTSLVSALNNDPTLYGIGLIGLIALVVPIFVLQHLRENERILYFLSGGTWFLSTSLFPWALLQKTPFNIIQFPWRFLGIQSLFYALILTVCCVQYFRISKVGIILFSLAMCLLNFTTAANYDINLKNVSGTINVNYDSIEQYTSEGMNYFLYDYVPKKSNNYRDKMEKKLFFIDNNWTSHKFQVKGNIYQTVIKLDIKQKVILPVVQYSNTKIEVNNEKIDSSSSQSGLIELNLDEGTNNITISYSHSIFFYISSLLTIGTLFFLIFEILKNIIVTR